MHRFKDKFEQGIENLEGKFKGDFPHCCSRFWALHANPSSDHNLHDVKASAAHLKHKVGKFYNIVNPNHRHDEEHEQVTDKKRSEIAESHRFHSFAPIHENNRVKWYVDGMDYLWAVSEALEKATETIYIADWWLSPELFLRRPPVDHQEWRLDHILKRRAEAGVKIYVIVYKEV
jgi:phospholipase D1/2